MTFLSILGYDQKSHALTYLCIDKWSGKDQDSIYNQLHIDYISVQIAHHHSITKSKTMRSMSSHP